MPHSEFDAGGRPPVVSYSRREAAAPARPARGGAAARLLKVALTTLAMIAGTAFLALPMPSGGEGATVQPILSVGLPQDEVRAVTSDALAPTAPPVIPSGSIGAVEELAALPQPIGIPAAAVAAAASPITAEGAPEFAAGNGKPPLPRLRPDGSGTTAASATTAGASGNDDAILRIVGWLIHTQ